MSVSLNAKVMSAAKDIGANAGVRCGPDSKREMCDLDTACVSAAALLMSTLIPLRSLAQVKPLGRDEIQAVIDSFFDNAGIDELPHPMGGHTYRRSEGKEA